VEPNTQAGGSRQPAVHAGDAEAAGGAQGDVLETLKREHEAVKGLLSSLAGSDSAEERRRLVRMIASALVPHSVAEEKVVYGALIALPDRDPQVDGYEGTLEHEWASKTLDRLAVIDDASSAEHQATAKVLKELVEHHIREEEQNIWRDVREHFSDEDRARLNSRYLSEKRDVRMPGTPA
jgi:hemerythrin superfamily protein